MIGVGRSIQHGGVHAASRLSYSREDPTRTGFPTGKAELELNGYTRILVYEQQSTKKEMQQPHPILANLIHVAEYLSFRVAVGQRHS